MIIGRRGNGKAKAEPKKNPEKSRKGRGKRAQETIREGRPVPRTKQHTKSDGPPIRIGGSSKKKPVKRPSITPDEVVNNRRK